MAVAIVEEYSRLARDEQGNVLPIPGGFVTSQRVTYTTSTATSSAFNEKTKFVFIQTVDTLAHIAFGDSPTAANTDRLIAAGDGRFFEAPKKSGKKVALYDGTS